MRLSFHWNPVTAKRWRRFRKMRRAWWSLWVLVALYVVSLFAGVLCNNTPLYVLHDGRVYLPLLRFTPEDVFLHNGKQTRPDYKALAVDPRFRDAPANRIAFPIIPFGPHETIDPASIPVASTVTLRFTPVSRAATVNVYPDLTIARTGGDAAFFLAPSAVGGGASFTNAWPITPALHDAIAMRFRNESAGSFDTTLERTGAPRRIRVRLAEFSPRDTAPATVRLTLQEETDGAPAADALVLDRSLTPVGTPPPFWQALDTGARSNLTALAAARFAGPVERLDLDIARRPFTVQAVRPEVTWPYRPVPGHWLGTDSAGRDVLVRLIYGLRTSMTFGLLLVVLSMGLGILAGAVQGYYGGRIDLTGQRLTEIWSAIPFLYVMILLGALYGRSFILLLIVYAVFNWIGLSYYMRAEFLRLRRQPFIEAARTTGLPDRHLMVRHILPNALVPVITFFPFSLVGAIGSLAALDYLGFGLPPPTPSWGELLQQAQQFRWAWWLILYPFMALFVVMLLGVFVGEGVRNAYDPRPESRIE